MINGRIFETVRGVPMRNLGNPVGCSDCFDHILAGTTGSADPGAVAQPCLPGDGIGAHSFARPAPGATVHDTNASNRLPETHCAKAPSPLIPAKGAYTGRLRSGIGDSACSSLGLASFRTLAGFVSNSAQDGLLNSDADRWADALADMSVGPKLPSASSGRMVGTQTMSNLLFTGDSILREHGDAFKCKPVHRVDALTGPEKCPAQFQFPNLNPLSTIGNSERFCLAFTVAAPPCPSHGSAPRSCAAWECGGGGWRMRRQSRMRAPRAIGTSC